MYRVYFIYISWQLLNSPNQSFQEGKRHAFIFCYIDRCVSEECFCFCCFFFLEITQRKLFKMIFLFPIVIEEYTWHTKGDNQWNKINSSTGSLASAQRASSCRVRLLLQLCWWSVWSCAWWEMTGMNNKSLLCFPY